MRWRAERCYTDIVAVLKAVFGKMTLFFQISNQQLLQQLFGVRAHKHMKKTKQQQHTGRDAK